MDLEHGAAAARRRCGVGGAAARWERHTRMGVGRIGEGGVGAGDSAGTKEQRSGEGTDGTTRVAGRGWGPEVSRGGSSRRGRLGLPAGERSPRKASARRS